MDALNRDELAQVRERDAEWDWADPHLARIVRDVAFQDRHRLIITLDETLATLTRLVDFVNRSDPAILDAFEFVEGARSDEAPV